MFFIGATLTSTTLLVAGVGLIALPISSAIVCTLSLANKVIHKLFINKCNILKKLCEKDQQTIKSFDELNRKSLQDNVIDKNEYESLGNILTKNLVKTKIESPL